MPTTKLKQTNPGELDFRVALTIETEGVRKRDRTRIAIGRGCCTLLEQLSLPELTVAKICQEAGIAHGTFYIHYKDRYALVADLLSKFVVFIQMAMRNASHAEPEQTVRAATAVYYQLFVQNQGLMKCLVNNLDEFPETRIAFQALNSDWANIVVAAVERKNAGSNSTVTVSREELYRRAYALGGMVDQYLSTLLLSQEPTLVSVSQDPDAVINTLSFIWKRALDL